VALKHLSALKDNTFVAVGFKYISSYSSYNVTVSLHSALI